MTRDLTTHRADAQFAIRPGRPGDLDAFVSLAAGIDMAPRWTRAMYATALESGDGSRVVMVAEAAGNVRGFAVILLSAPACGSEATIESIAVDPGSRRRGAGRRLLHALLAWARAEGASACLLEVRERNSEAIRLYCQAGFAVIGRRPGYYNEPEDAGIVMRREMTQTAEFADV